MPKVLTMASQVSCGHNGQVAVQSTAKLSVATLSDLPHGAHCATCNIDYDRDFERNVELTFAPAPAVRPLPVVVVSAFTGRHSAHDWKGRFGGASAICRRTSSRPTPCRRCSAGAFDPLAHTAFARCGFNVIVILPKKRGHTDIRPKSPLR